MKKQEFIGKLIIQENVSPIERNKINNTFVIDVPNPLATYYSRFTEVNRPNSIILVTKHPISFEQILRATKNINKKDNFNIDGAKCEVNIGNRKFTGIRVKGIERYTDIEKIQNAFKKEGFEFLKNESLGKNSDALIRVNKFFDLKKIEEGIYQSLHNTNRFYIVIPKNMTWDAFRELTFDIKNNVSVTNYDIAKGIFYNNRGIIDMLRVIKPNITVEMVREIQKKYLDRLS